MCQPPACHLTVNGALRMFENSNSSSSGLFVRPAAESGLEQTTSAGSAIMSESNAFQSPALHSGGSSGNAFEVKCVMDETTAEAIEAMLSGSMTLDPHAAANGCYRITTLATDTADLCTFHRRPQFSGIKFRIRRYGDEASVYLEQKQRRGNRVRKRRSRVALPLPLDFDRRRGSEDAPDAWFWSEISSRSLRPVCLSSCERRAWFAFGEFGPLRLTLDRQLRAMLISDWNMELTENLPPLLDRVICEFKFSESMPVLFRQAVQEFQLSLGGFSKFRTCVSLLTGLAISQKSGAPVK